MLRCAICASTNKNNLTEAVTIINGTAVCFRHIHEASVTRHFLDAWSLARDNEARAEAQSMSTHLQLHEFIPANPTPNEHTPCLLCGFSAKFHLSRDENLHYFAGDRPFCTRCGMIEDAPTHVSKSNG